jgi:hypothetical protein
MFLLRRFRAPGLMFMVTPSLCFSEHSVSFGWIPLQLKDYGRAVSLSKSLNSREDGAITRYP